MIEDLLQINFFSLFFAQNLIEGFLMKGFIFLFILFAFESGATFTSQRNDVMGGVVLQTNNGTPWGKWGEARFCPANTFAIGFSLKVEGHQSEDDDTAVNNIKLVCGDYSVFEFEGDSRSSWGSYGQNSYCPNNSFIKGFALKVEKDQPLGHDDTAVNDMKVFCGNNYEEVGSTNGQRFGSFGSNAYCPGYSSICGFSLKSEEPQGMADDTAVNDVAFYCCHH